MKKKIISLFCLSLMFGMNVEAQVNKSKKSAPIIKKVEVAKKEEVVTFKEDKNTSAFYSAQKGAEKFNRPQRKFDSWSIQLFGGGNAIQGADLISWGHGVYDTGFDLQFGITKQITHAFGLQLLGAYGETKQHYNNVKGRTEYTSATLMGDLNLSSLMRRVDNKSRYAWSLHAYAGVGILGYDAYRLVDNGRDAVLGYSDSKFHVVDNVDIDDYSLFGQVGAGLRYKLNQSFDIELKSMVVWTGDEAFDGSGRATWNEVGPSVAYNPYANIKPYGDDKMITASLGLHYKIGPHPEHLSWVDPLAALYPPKIPVIPKVEQVKVCAKGDKDRDGVCDDWDKQLDTPEGARIDGAGVALDVDQDGIIDLYDKCVTIPGVANKDPKLNGCAPARNLSIELSAALEGVQFDLGKDKIRTKSFAKLNKAAELLKTAGVSKSYTVEGHTDSRGKADKNMALSAARAAAVVRYLSEKGVDVSEINSIGKGLTDLKYKECENPKAKECPEWKNEANRRVIFIPKN